VAQKKNIDTELIRFGVSIESGLLERYDQLIEKKGYTNRSEALRDLIRDSLVQQEFLSDLPVYGSLTIVYNHHSSDIAHKITHIQHDYGDMIISTLHVHLSHEDCMEVIALKGPGSRMKQFSDALLGMKGVKHGKLVVTSTQME
jgi:CopG family nickel-responsive transcriptional regulator